MFRGSDIFSHHICKYEVLVMSLNSSYDRFTYCETRSGVVALCGGNWVFEPATILAKILWGTLAECNASTMDRSSPKTKVLWAKSCPPPPQCNVVRKESLAEESPNIAGAGANIAGIRHKRQSVPHLSLARIVIAPKLLTGVRLCGGAACRLGGRC